MSDNATYYLTFAWGTDGTFRLYTYDSGSGFTVVSSTLTSGSGGASFNIQPTRCYDNGSPYTPTSSTPSAANHWKITSCLLGLDPTATYDNPVTMPTATVSSSGDLLTIDDAGGDDEVLFYYYVQVEVGDDGSSLGNFPANVDVIWDPQIQNEGGTENEPMAERGLLVRRP